MNKIAVFLFLLAVIIEPIFNSNGNLSAIRFSAPSPALNGEIVMFEVTSQDMTFTLDAQGDLQNKAALKTVAKTKYQAAVSERLALKQAIADKASADAIAAGKIKIVVNDSDLQ